MDARFWLAAVLIGAASFIACSDNSASQRESTEPAPPAASAGNEDPIGSSEERLSHGQIASITTAANTAEIAQANAALPKLTHAEAMQFAKMMLEQHGAAQDRQAAMLQAKGITPMSHPLATELSRDSDEILEELSAADRDEIDELYMEKQVEVHEDVLEALDNKLIPSATDPELLQELQTTRSDVAMHLQRAREIVSNLD